MKKKILCLTLAMLMVLSIMPISAFAAQVKCERPLQFEENIARELKALNLFKGVSDTNFALEKVPTRIEALVIMLRLMGKESEILAGSYKHPFTDVPSWANNYVGYAYENKLTNGMSKNKFGAGNATDVQFLTFVLRAMGYSDSDGDFTWDNPYDLAKDLGILTCAITTGSGFLRADCASISYNALAAKLKEGGKTLAEKLISDKVFTGAAYDLAVKSIPDYADVIRVFNLKWHDYPQSNNDIIDNLCYTFVTGNFEWTHDNRAIPDIPRLAGLRPEVAGHLLNQGHHFLELQGRYYVTVSSDAISPLSPEDISNQIIDAYKAAKKIHDELHANGTITDSMTEKQKAQIYANYLDSFGVQIPKEFTGDNWPENYDVPAFRINYMICDSAYGCLVEKSGNCGARAAGYCLLLNMEGIKSLGLPVEGHIISYMFLDGEEYLCDWINGIGLFTVDEVRSKKKASWMTFDENWLRTVRDYYPSFCGK